MSPPGMFGGYQETSRESVVTSVSVGQSGGEAAEQKGWQGREQKKISGLNTTRAIGLMNMGNEKENSYAFHH